MAKKSNRPRGLSRLGSKLRRTDLPEWMQVKASLFLRMAANLSGQAGALPFYFSRHWRPGDAAGHGDHVRECVAWGRRHALHLYLRLRYRALRDVLCHAAAHELRQSDDHADPLWAAALVRARDLWYSMDHELAELTDIEIGHHQWEWIRSPMGEESRRHKWPRK